MCFVLLDVTIFYVKSWKSLHKLSKFDHTIEICWENLEPAGREMKTAKLKVRNSGKGTNLDA